MSAATVSRYKPEFRSAFVELNREWIEKYFTIEAMDLMKAAVAWAREKKASQVEILSNAKLTPTIALYKKHGFVEAGSQHPDYKRCNIQMILKID